MPAEGLLVREAFPGEYGAAKCAYEATMGPLTDKCDREWSRARFIKLPHDEAFKRCQAQGRLSQIGGCIRYEPEDAWQDGSYPLIIAAEGEDSGEVVKHELGHLGAHCTRGGLVWDRWDYGHCSAYFETLGVACDPSKVPRRVTGRN